MNEAIKELGKRFKELLKFYSYVDSDEELIQLKEIDKAICIVDKLIYDIDSKLTRLEDQRITTIVKFLIDRKDGEE